MDGSDSNRSVEWLSMFITTTMLLPSSTIRLTWIVLREGFRNLTKRIEHCLPFRSTRSVTLTWRQADQDTIIHISELAYIHPVVESLVCRDMYIRKCRVDWYGIGQHRISGNWVTIVSRAEFFFWKAFTWWVSQGSDQSSLPRELSVIGMAMGGVWVAANYAGMA